MSAFIVTAKVRHFAVWAPMQSGQQSGIHRPLCGGGPTRTWPSPFFASDLRHLSQDGDHWRKPLCRRCLKVVNDFASVVPS